MGRERRSGAADGWYAPPVERYFHVHPMKTAGGTLSWVLRRNLSGAAVYPGDHPGEEPYASKGSIKKLLELPPERRAALRAYTCHVPFYVAELVDPDLVTMTVLRDPVDRTISHLDQLSRLSPRYQGRHPEELYDDRQVFRRQIHNHQTRFFALTEADRAPDFRKPLDIDADRLALAKDNLERVDLVGLTEHLVDLLAELERRYGWDVDIPKVNEGSGARWDFSPSFRDRVAEDNAADMELYEHACRLDERRRAAAAGSGRQPLPGSRHG